MTSQTKHYIEVKDLIALRCDCRHCEASLSVALRDGAVRALEVCPACNKTWAQGTNQKEINGFVQQAKILKTLADTLGFTLYLEVSAPVSGEQA